MIKSFQLARGVQVGDLTGIDEGYSIRLNPAGHYVFTINVSAEKISAVFRELAAQVREPGFLLFEIPTHRDDEEPLRKNPSDPFYRDVYYLDGLTWRDADDLLTAHEQLLTHDGEIDFGFGSHSGRDEVLVGHYKIFQVFADEPNKYQLALARLAYMEVPELRTVWQNFTRETPGQRHVLKDEKPTIYEMIEELKGEGLYFAERRPD